MAAILKPTCVAAYPESCYIRFILTGGNGPAFVNICDFQPWLAPTSATHQRTIIRKRFPNLAPGLTLETCVCVFKRAITCANVSACSFKRKVPMVALTTVDHGRSDLVVWYKQNNMVSTRGENSVCTHLHSSFSSFIFFVFHLRHIGLLHLLFCFTSSVFS